MTFKAMSSRIKTIHQQDPDFLIQDGFVLSPRAGFEITTDCPYEYKLIIAKCMDQGWLKPVAHMMDAEVAWERLMS